MTEKKMVKHVQDYALKRMKDKIEEYQKIEDESDIDKQILGRLEESYADFTAKISYFSALDVIMAIGRAIHGR